MSGPTGVIVRVVCVRGAIRLQFVAFLCSKTSSRASSAGVQSCPLSDDDVHDVSGSRKHHGLHEVIEHRMTDTIAAGATLLIYQVWCGTAGLQTRPSTSRLESHLTWGQFVHRVV